MPEERPAAEETLVDEVEWEDDGTSDSELGSSDADAASEGGETTSD